MAQTEAVELVESDEEKADVFDRIDKLMTDFDGVASVQILGAGKSCIVEIHPAQANPMTDVSVSGKRSAWATLVTEAFKQFYRSDEEDGE